MLKTALILIVGALAVVFDTTIVSVALHQLATDLRVSVSTIQWVTTGYMLALGVTVPLSTWALSRFGGKRVWMFALAVFLVGSIGSSLAWDAGSLIGWRVVQGLGGGLMMPVMLTLVMQAAGGRQLGRTAAWVSLPALLGPILGPLVGGAIITNLSWRYMFWVNVPFCVVGLILAGLYLPKDTAAASAVRPARRAGPRPAQARHLGADPRAVERRYGARLRPPRCHRASLPCVACSSPSRSMRCAAADPLVDIRLLATRSGRLVIHGVVPVGLLAVRGDAPAAAVLPGGPRCHAR